MNIFYGLCVSQGNVKGRAFTITSIQQLGCHIPKDSIIVIMQLDREMLLNLNDTVIGVVAELGNIGSHGSGILRQLGIPCVLRIKNATKVINTGDIIEVCGDKNCVISYNSTLTGINESKNIKYGQLYKKIAKKDFNVSDIGIISNLTCARPERSYQRMRFDIIREAYATGANFLFGLPKGNVIQNDFGAIAVYGAPCIADICSFVLANPEWLLKKSQERTFVIDKIKAILSSQLNIIHSCDLKDVLTIFTTGIDLYRELFLYAHMSQAISDEILEIYLDFLGFLYGKSYVTDIINLKSDYVEKCLNSRIDPGVSQRWFPDKAIPHIWDGSINYDRLTEDASVLDRIKQCDYYDKGQLLKDYNSFRIIVPLVYQLSEEFFYISSTINTFINWGISILYQKINELKSLKLSLFDIYEWPLDKFMREVNECINLQEHYNLS